MSRIPVYDVGGSGSEHNHNLDDRLASAFGDLAEVYSGLEGAVAGSLEFARQNMRRVQSMLSREVGRGLRRVDENVRTSANQLDGRIANATAELAGTLRGINGIVGTQRAITEELDKTRPAIPAVVKVEGSKNAKPIFQSPKPQAQKGVGSPSMGSSTGLVGSISGGSGETPLAFSIAPISGVPEVYQVASGESESGVGGGGFATTAEPDDGGQGQFEPVESTGRLPPMGLHPSLAQLAERLPAAGQSTGAVCCPPPPVVNVTVQPSRIDITGLTQFITDLLMRNGSADAFPQAPSSGSAETPGFDPSQYGDAANGDDDTGEHETMARELSTFDAEAEYAAQLILATLATVAR